jgi:hypothetical protein
MDGCFTVGEAEARRGRIVRIVASEKRMLGRASDRRVTGA